MEIPKTLSKHCRRMIEYGLYDFVSLDRIPEAVVVQTKPNVEPHYAMVLARVVAVIKCKKLDKELDNLVHVRFGNNSYKTFTLSQVNVLQKKRGGYDYPFEPVQIKRSLGVAKLWYPGCSWSPDRTKHNLFMYPDFEIFNQNGKRITNLGDITATMELEKYIGFRDDDFMSGKFNIFFDTFNPNVDKNGAIPSEHYTSFAEMRKMALMMKVMLLKKAEKDNMK